MKSAAIFKIIVWSLVTVFLIGFLITIAVSGAGFGGMPFSIDLSRIGGEVELVREQEFSADDIESLYLKWASASVYITPTDGDKIIVTEKASGNITEDELLQISERDGTLFMEQGTQRRRFFVFNFGRRVVNEIRLPEKDYNKIITRLTSGKIEMNDLVFETVDAEMTSGLLDFRGLSSENIIIDITSGKAEISGSFSDINAKMTSGLLDIETDTAPENLRVDLTSGKGIVTIPDNEGFIVGVNKTSGVFSTNFNLDEFNRYGTGDRQYSIKMTSGKVELLKK